MSSIKIILLIIISIVHFKFIYSQNREIDGRVKVSNINLLINDSFYFKENDTIFFAVYYPQKMQKSKIKYYLKCKKEWIYQVHNTVIEKGNFRKKRYPVKYIFRKKIKEFEKWGNWYYR